VGEGKKLCSFLGMRATYSRRRQAILRRAFTREQLCAECNYVLCAQVPELLQPGFRRIYTQLRPNHRRGRGARASAMLPPWQPGPTAPGGPLGVVFKLEKWVAKVNGAGRRGGGSIQTLTLLLARFISTRPWQVLMPPGCPASGNCPPEERSAPLGRRHFPPTLESTSAGLGSVHKSVSLQVGLDMDTW